MTNPVALGERYFIYSRSNWHVEGQDQFSAIIKDRATGRAFTIIAPIDIQQLVLESMNIVDAARDRAGE